MSADPATAIAAQLDSWHPVDLTTLPEHPPVQPTLGRIGDIGLVYPGKRHVFSGPPESAKTLAAYAIGLQVIRQDGPIVLIDFEMGAYDARNRLRELGATNDDLSSLLYLSPDEPATEQRLARLLDHAPELVIIDAAAGMYSLQGLDDERRKDVETISSLYVKLFWRAGIATLVLDHVVKNAENRGKFTIGSERKTGGADVHLGFETITPISRGHTGLYKILTHKDRGGYLKRGILAELELASDPDTHQITWQFRAAQEIAEGETWMPTKVMQKVSEALERQTEPVTANAIVAEVGGRKDVVLKAIGHLTRLGYATETAGARGAKLLHHTRPFTVLEWENQPDQTTGSHRFPPVPGTSHPLVPTSSPPYGGNGTSDAAGTTRPVPDQDEGWPVQQHELDWIDYLTPKEHPPADLHDTDDIDFG